MTPAQQQPERDLSQTLARQAERFAEAGGSPLELDQILSRAGEIRRGRRMRASMVMAAVVLAVAVPVGITTLSENDPTRPPVQPAATTTPSPTVVDTAPVELGEYDAGDAPKNGYVENGTLHYGSTQKELGGGEVNYLARIDGGFLVGQQDKVRFVGQDGTFGDQSWTLTTGIAVAPQRLFAAFVETDGTVLAVDGSGQSYEVGKLPAQKDTFSYETVAVSDGDCSGRTAEDCSVWVVETGEVQTLWEISATTGANKVPDLDGLIAVDQSGNIVRQIAYDDYDGATSAFFDVNGKQLWTSKKYAPKSFSPDGKYLLAGPAYGDGYGDTQLTILSSATGKPVLDLKTARVGSNSPLITVLQTAWEDDSHVLAVVVEGQSFAILRFGLDGSREYAVAKLDVPDSAGASPFLLGG